MVNFNSGWYLIYTRPRCERKVAIQLDENSVEYFFPTVKEVRQWHDRRKVVDAPLFHSYLFVHLLKVQDMYAGMDAEGAVRFVGFGKDIARVPEGTIEGLKLLVQYGEELKVTDENFRPGQQLYIGQGGLSGMKCEVVEHNHEKKLIVRVQLINRAVLAEVPKHACVPVL